MIGIIAQDIYDTFAYWGSGLFGAVLFTIRYDKFDEIMQSKYAYLAIDDMTDYYSEKALQEVSEMYDDVHRTFFDQGDEFLEGMDYILKALKAAIDFTERWKASRINPDIDNT